MNASPRLSVYQTFRDADIERVVGRVHVLDFAADSIVVRAFATFTKTLENVSDDTLPRLRGARKGRATRNTPGLRP